MGSCKILFLAANPADTSSLALDEEIREIRTKIRAADHRDDLELVSRWAVRPDDLLQSLNELRPQRVWNVPRRNLLHRPRGRPR